MRVRTAIGAAVAGVLACWVVAPMVSLARTGTIDQRTAAGWREEVRPCEARRDEARRDEVRRDEVRRDEVRRAGSGRRAARERDPRERDPRERDPRDGIPSPRAATAPAGRLRTSVSHWCSPVRTCGDTNVAS